MANRTCRGRPGLFTPVQRRESRPSQEIRSPGGIRTRAVHWRPSFPDRIRRQRTPLAACAVFSMPHHRPLLAHVSLVLATAGVLASAGHAISGQSKAAATPARAASVVKHWTADNGNGTYSNPLFHEEFEDPDVIRVGADYYLAGTTMHMNPGVQIMHSRDLVNWELAGYAIDRLDLGPTYRLEGGNVYGRGIWAPCIRYHQGMFYVFSNVNGAGLQVFRAASINGPWERNQLPGRHDLSVLFDDDLGKI